MPCDVLQADISTPSPSLCFDRLQTVMEFGSVCVLTQLFVPFKDDGGCDGLTFGVLKLFKGLKARSTFRT